MGVGAPARLGECKSSCLGTPGISQRGQGRPGARSRQEPWVPAAAGLGPCPSLSGSGRGPVSPNATPLQLCLHFKINFFFFFLPEGGGMPCPTLQSLAQGSREGSWDMWSHIPFCTVGRRWEAVAHPTLSHKGAWWGWSSPAWGGKCPALWGPGKAPTIPPRGLRWGGRTGLGRMGLCQAGGAPASPGRGSDPLRAPPAPNQVPAPLVPPAAAGPRLHPQLTTHDCGLALHQWSEVPVMVHGFPGWGTRWGRLGGLTAPPARRASQHQGSSA